jgi:glycine cleavage system H protein
MSRWRGESVYYRRSRFTTHLPVDRRYTAAHYWLAEEASGIWRVGFTKFATRMLGDIVEYELTRSPGAAISVGDDIGWMEGLKAVTTIFSVGTGQFLGAGGSIASDITLIESDPYGQGSLYRIEGQPAADAVDVHGYIAILDATIDKMLASRHADEGVNDGR